MLNLKTFQIIPKGIIVEDNDDNTKIQVPLSGKDLILFGIGGTIFSIVLICFFTMNPEIKQDNLPLAIAGIGVFILVFSSLIICGISTSRSKLMIHIDKDKNLTVIDTSPAFFAKRPMIFYSKNNNSIYQTLSHRQGTHYYLSMESKKLKSHDLDSYDLKTYVFPKLANNEKTMLWLLFTISEVFDHAPNPVGPPKAVSEIRTQLNRIKQNKSESENN